MKMRKELQKIHQSNQKPSSHVLFFLIQTRATISPSKQFITGGDYGPRLGTLTGVVPLLQWGHRGSLKTWGTRWLGWVKQVCFLLLWLLAESCEPESGHLQGALLCLLVPKLPYCLALPARAPQLDLPTDFPEAPAGPRAWLWESMEGRSMESPLLAAWGTWRGSESRRVLAVETLMEKKKINEVLKLFSQSGNYWSSSGVSTSCY